MAVVSVLYSLHLAKQTNKFKLSKWQKLQCWSSSENSQFTQLCCKSTYLIQILSRLNYPSRFPPVIFTITGSLWTQEDLSFTNRCCFCHLIVELKLINEIIKLSNLMHKLQGRQMIFRSKIIPCLFFTFICFLISNPISISGQLVLRILNSMRIKISILSLIQQFYHNMNCWRQGRLWNYKVIHIKFSCSHISDISINIIQFLGFCYLFCSLLQSRSRCQML